MNRERLRADYQEAFDEWSLQVSLLQGLIASEPASFVMEEAKERVVAAEGTYHISRNRLTDHMVADSTETTTCD